MHQEGTDKRLLVTVRGLSEITGFSEPWIRARVFKKTIPFYKIGGRVLFKQGEVENWILNFQEKGVNDAE